MPVTQPVSRLTIGATSGMHRSIRVGVMLSHPAPRYSQSKSWWHSLRQNVCDRPAGPSAVRPVSAFTAISAQPVRLVCRQRACHLIVQAAETLTEAGGGRIQFEGEPWNTNTVSLIRSAKAHLQLVLLETFAQSVADFKTEVMPSSSPANKWLIVPVIVV